MEKIIYLKEKKMEKKNFLNFAALRKALYDAQLSERARLVYIHLLQKSSIKGCNPNALYNAVELTKQQIAIDLGILTKKGEPANKSVQRALEELEALGYLKRFQKYKSEGCPLTIMLNFKKEFLNKKIEIEDKKESDFVKTDDKFVHPYNPFLSINNPSLSINNINNNILEEKKHFNIECKNENIEINREEPYEDKNLEKELETAIEESLIPTVNKKVEVKKQCVQHCDVSVKRKSIPDEEDLASYLKRTKVYA